MSNGQISVARQFMDTYADGDAEGLLACLGDAWVLHEEGGSTTSRADIAEITRSHADSFPEKQIEWLHELVDGDRVAHYVRFTRPLRPLSRSRTDGQAGRAVGDDFPPI
jgi:hypothetical protein